MRAELLQMRQASLQSVRYAADRIDDKIKFTDDALKLMLNVPRVFLPAALKGCVDWGVEFYSNTPTKGKPKELQVHL